MPERETSPQNRKPAQRATRLVAAVILAAFSGADSQALLAENADIIEIKDKALVARLWQAVHPDSALPRGEFQVLIPYDQHVPSGEQPGSAYLLRNGTEVGQLDMEEWKEISAAAKSSWWKGSLKSGDPKDTPPVWRVFGADLDTWISRAEWPSGLRFAVNSTFNNVPHSGLQFERQIDMEWQQKLFRHFLLGASLHRTQYGGGLTYTWARTQSNDDPFAPDPDYWTDPYWWWTASWGLPGFRYTASLASRPMPEHFWLEKDADSLVRNREEGNVVRQWTGETLEIEGNFAHTLDFRLSHFRYGLHFDGDAYSGAVHTVMFEDVPAFFGAWGAGIIASGGSAATRFWLDIPDLAFNLPAPRAYPSDFRIAFLRIELGYRSIRSFSLGLSVTVKLDNPILKLPGAKS
jgi:hypothetical protein